MVCKLYLNVSKAHELPSLYALEWLELFKKLYQDCQDAEQLEL